MSLTGFGNKYELLKTAPPSQRPRINYGNLAELVDRINTLIDTQMDIEASPVIVKFIKWAFNAENRIRALEGRPPITIEQVKDAIRNL